MQEKHGSSSIWLALKKPETYYTPISRIASRLNAAYGVRYTILRAVSLLLWSWRSVLKKLGLNRAFPAQTPTSDARKPLAAARAAHGQQRTRQMNRIDKEDP